MSQYVMVNHVKEPKEKGYYNVSNKKRLIIKTLLVNVFNLHNKNTCYLLLQQQLTCK